MSSIIGRFLNYLLVPIYTNALPVESGGYGVITNMYAITALLMVLLTYGMETGFFRFANKGVDDPMRVYSTTLLSVGATAVLFLIVCLSFLYPIAGFLGYGEHPWYMGMMLIVVAMDAFQAIPFAYLRYKKRPVKFAALKLLFIFASIVLNIAYFVGMKGENVGVAFAINLACTSLVMLCMWKELVGFRYVLDRELLRRMLHYSFPILILGIAGILNQVADKIIFPFVYPDKAEATIQLGIYGAASKIAMIMAMLCLAIKNILNAALPILVDRADVFSGQGNLKGVYAMHFLIGLTGIIMAFLLCSLSFYLGADAIQGMLDFIPPFVLAGFGVAANILPAMGFAMLGRLVLTKQLVPFYFLGFLLCSYANVPVLGVALIAIIIGIDKFDLLGLGGAQPQLSAEGDEDDDF